MSQTIVDEDFVVVGTSVVMKGDVVDYQNHDGKNLTGMVMRVQKKSVLINIGSNRLVKVKTKHIKARSRVRIQVEIDSLKEI